MTGEWPPKSATKDEIIASSRGPGRQLCYDIVAQLIAFMGNGQCVLSVQDVRAWVAHQRGLDLRHGQLESLKLLRGALMAAGLKSPKARFRIDGILTNVVANFVIPEDAGWAQLKDRYKTVEALWPVAGTGNGAGSAAPGSGPAAAAGVATNQGQGPAEYM
jgi:hypothetical protein